MSHEDVGALYVESLGEVFTVDALRVAIGMQARVPSIVWAVLYALTILGMVSIGYQNGIAGSKRSRATVVLGLAFATRYLSMRHEEGGCCGRLPSGVVGALDV